MTFPAVNTVNFKLYFDENMSLREIANKFNIKKYVGTLNKMLDRFGFERKRYQSRKSRLVSDDREKNNRIHEFISRSYLTKYKSSAKHRNIEFSITVDDIWDLYIKQNKKCALSGIDIHFPIDSYEFELHNWTCSIDRIDSGGNYTIDNIQLVHKDINRIKQHYSQDYFIEMCTKIADNNRK